MALVLGWVWGMVLISFSCCGFDCWVGMVEFDLWLCGFCCFRFWISGLRFGVSGFCG